MITALTPEQTAKIAEYRERYFAQATSTKPADRPRADAAARRLAEIGGVNVAHVVWVASPADGAAEYGRAWGSLGASLRDSFGASLGASLRDSGWLAYYSYGVEVLGVSCGNRERELLGLHNEIAASCFALWIVPGMVILCERPATVEVVDGRLVGLTWRDMA